MTKLKVWHWMVLIVFLPLVLGSKCWITKKELVNPPPQPCGVGEGQYQFYLVNTVPDSFDCNDSGRFVITIRPNINPSYSGTDVFNRLYFILENGTGIYISNYVEFLSGNTADQQLEWGGSVSTGDYEVCGRMKNIQLNSYCPDSVREVCYKDLGWIHITEFANPQKVMVIEYDCQLADTLFYRYDVFEHGWDLEEYMNIAFNIANTTYNIIEDNKDLPCSMLVWNEPVFPECRDYILNNKADSTKMYLCGIKGFHDGYGNFLPQYRGLSLLRDTTTFLPSARSGSLIAIKAIINTAATFYKVYYNELITAITIHELGHQRGIPGHEGCSSQFCIMSGPTIQAYHNTYSNPHFCENCIYRIKNISW